MNPYLAGMSNVERNGKIYWSVVAGATYKEAASQAGLSAARVAQIYWRERNRRRNDRLAREISALHAVGLGPTEARTVVLQDERENARICAEDNAAWYFNPEVRGKYGASDRPAKMQDARSAPRPDRWRLHDDLLRNMAERI